MSKANLSKWLREEHRKTMDLGRKLREELAAHTGSPTEEWLRSLRATFEQFRAHLVKHIALEEEGGYLKPVVEARPTLSGHVEALRQDHAQFQMLMEGIQHSLSRVEAGQSVLLRDAAQRIETLLDCVHAHDRQENQMLLWVLSTDIGGGD